MALKGAVPFRKDLLIPGRLVDCLEHQIPDNRGFVCFRLYLKHSEARLSLLPKGTGDNEGAMVLLGKTLACQRAKPDDIYGTSSSATKGKD